MAIQFGTKAIIQEIGKYGFGIVTGTGITLASLLAWTGAEDLQAIKDKFYDFESKAQIEIDSAVLEYSQVVVDANAEIGEYKVALQQANDNISQLITAYNQAEQEHQTEVSNLQQTHQTELANKQAELENLQTQLKEQYVSVEETNKIIEKANDEIGQANQDVADTKSDIENYVEYSTVSDGSYLQDKLNGVEVKLDTEGEPKATDIPSNIEIPTQEQGE